MKNIFIGVYVYTANLRVLRMVFNFPVSLTKVKLVDGNPVSENFLQFANISFVRTLNQQARNISDDESATSSQFL